MKPASKTDVATDAVAAAAASNGNSLTTVPIGTVLRDGKVWAIEQEWRGAELQRYDYRRSRWSKNTVVRLFVTAGPRPGEDTPAFTLHLPYNTSEEDARAQAAVWMMALNMRRKE